ncbi:MAG: hypothetical protein Q8O03_08015 [Nanoarchaeota archaeon]|nr:hypothetical protein [Nanoarchaeota archaeon]
MRKALLILLLVLVLVVAGCGKKVSVTIEDEPEKITPEVICNNDAKCDTLEECDCSDCKETFACRKLALGKDEYLLKEGMSERISEKNLMFLDLDSSGKTTIKVVDVTRVIDRTKFKEIINSLEVTVLETEYDVDPEKVIVQLLVKKYVPGLDEYFFEREGSEMIIESVRIKLNRVESSVPANFVRLDVGNKLNEKVKEGETRAIEGLSITLVEAHPRGTPAESYAILKVKKA